MTLLRSLPALLLVVASTITPRCHAIDELLNDKIDTNRDYELLKPQYIVGAVYDQTTQVDQTTKIEITPGQKVDQLMSFEVENTMSVTGAPGGGKEIDIEYTHIAMSMTAMGTKLEFDSAADENDENNSKIFGPVGDLVGHHINILLDDEDTFVKASENEDLIKKLSNGGNNGGPAKDLASPKQFNQMTRMAKTLPDEPIKPGESWDFDLDMDVSRFKGTSTLLGYLDVDGNDCAVVVMEGSFDLNTEKLGEMMDEINEKEGSDGGEISEAIQGMKVTDGKMTSTSYWDKNKKFARWCEMTLSLTMEMPNPVGDGVLEIPTEQVMKVTTNIKE